MFMTALAAATVAASPAPQQAATPVPEIAAEYVGSKSRDAQRQVWTRQDIRFTNREATRQTVRVCPNDAFRRYVMSITRMRKQVVRMHAHALAVDGRNFQYRCIEQELDPGASTQIGFYFGHGKGLDFTGPITLATTFGTFEVLDGKAASVVKPAPRETEDLKQDETATSFLTLMSAPLLAGSSVTAEFGGYKHNNLGERRWTRYDYLLTNNGTEPQELAGCPGDIEIALHTHRVQSEKAFALSFDGGPWSYGCEQRQIAPGETVTVGAFFHEWWTLPGTSGRRLKLVTADTNLGTYTLRFQCPEGSDRHTCRRLLGD